MTTTPGSSQSEPRRGPTTDTGAPPTTPQQTQPADRPVLAFRDVPDGRDLLTARRRPIAARGWRKLAAKITGGRWNPEPSAKQELDAQLIASIRSPLGGVHKVAFVSAKGGVGKSTMTVAVGSTIARLRGDRVIAVDVDADLGDLSARFSEGGGPQANVEQLASLQNIERYSDVREHTVVNGDRLELLGAQNDPHSTYRFGPEDYLATINILEKHCNVILLDCGTSINGPLFSELVAGITGLVVVASQDVRGVEGALATLDWLHAHGFDQLLEHTIVALNALQKGKPFIDRETVENQFKKRVPEVFRVPYDPHLATGLAVDFTALKRKTREALLALASGVAAHYPPSQRPPRRDEWDTWIDSIRRDKGGQASPGS
jgi:MinD-like ATPase involved in chromosome partitioning or flagellar assembly